jgi:hypothetical protein
VPQDTGHVRRQIQVEDMLWLLFDQVMKAGHGVGVLKSYILASCLMPVYNEARMLKGESTDLAFCGCSTPLQDGKENSGKLADVSRVGTSFCPISGQDCLLFPVFHTIMTSPSIAADPGPESPHSDGEVAGRPITGRPALACLRCKRRKIKVGRVG